MTTTACDDQFAPDPDTRPHAAMEREHHEKIVGIMAGEMAQASGQAPAASAEPVLRIYAEGSMRSVTEWLDGARDLPDGDHTLYTAPVAAQAPAADGDALREAVKTAYGYLWHVNNEPGTPNQYAPERAAYKARIVLREQLTKDERGEGINVVRAAMCKEGRGDE